MRAENIQTSHRDRANLTSNCLKIDNLLLKPFWLCVSSLLSMAIVLSSLPARAEEQASVLPDSQTTDSEFNSLSSFHSSEDRSIENHTIAISDTASNASILHNFSQALHHAPLESWLATSENSVYAAQVLQQTNPLSVESSIENTEENTGFIEFSTKSIEAISSLNSIAEATEFKRSDSTIQPADIEPTDIEPTDIEPTNIETIEPSDIELINIETIQLIETTNGESSEPTPFAPIAQDDEPAESLPSPAPSNPPEEPLRERWQFSAEPYFFLPLDIQADITVDGRSTSLDLGLDDILNLDRVFDAGLRLGAQRNRWGIVLDGFYAYGERSGRLGQTFSAGSLFQFVQRTAPRSLQQFVQQYDPAQIQQFVQLGRQIGLNTPVRISANGTVSVRQITVDAAVSYRAVDTSLNTSPTATNFYPRLIVAPILGVRTNFLRQTIEVNTIRIDNAPIPDDALPRIDRKFRFSRTLVEPLVGAEVGLALSERWALGLRGDVSGFNIGADQNLTWNLLAGVQYRLSRLASLQLAYRFNSFDFEDGEGFARAKLNLRQNGLWLSAMFQF